MANFEDQLRKLDNVTAAMREALKENPQGSAEAAQDAQRRLAEQAQQQGR